MKRIKTEKGSAIVSEDIPKQTSDVLNKIAKLAYEQQQKPLNIGDVVESAELVACDDQGTPIIREDGKKICNCSDPMQSHFPDSKYYCLKCWGEWYH